MKNKGPLDTKRSEAKESDQDPSKYKTHYNLSKSQPTG